MFGLEPGTFDGKLETYMGFLHPEDRERVGIIIRHAIQTPGETGTDYELRILRPDGTMRWLVARGAVRARCAGQAGAHARHGDGCDPPALRRGGALRMERKLQESQKLESLGVLAGGIAHDFNNLLTGILGNASLARMDLPRRFAGAAFARTSRTRRPARRRSCASRCSPIPARGASSSSDSTSAPWCARPAELLQVSISKKCVLKYALAADLPAISADATQIRQIIMNLVINASEAIGDKSGVIGIATGVMQADRAYLTEAHLSPNIPEGEYVFLEVSDNGAGMDSETRARIFDPFFTTKFTGRGLGLAAVLGIVRGHSGALKVYSEAGPRDDFQASAAARRKDWRNPAGAPVNPASVARRRHRAGGG